MWTRCRERERKRRESLSFSLGFGKENREIISVIVFSEKLGFAIQFRQVIYFSFPPLSLFPSLSNRNRKRKRRGHDDSMGGISSSRTQLLLDRLLKTYFSEQRCVPFLCFYSLGFLLLIYLSFLFSSVMCIMLFQKGYDFEHRKQFKNLNELYDT